MKTKKHNKKHVEVIEGETMSLFMRLDDNQMSLLKLLTAEVSDHDLLIAVGRNVLAVLAVFDFLERHRGRDDLFWEKEELESARQAIHAAGKKAMMVRNKKGRA